MSRPRVVESERIAEHRYRLVLRCGHVRELRSLRAAIPKRAICGTCVGAPVRTYRTDETRRLIARDRRDGLRARKLCINGEAHGPATRSTRCDPCAVQLERSR